MEKIKLLIQRIWLSIYLAVNTFYLLHMEIIFYFSYPTTEIAR